MVDGRPPCGRSTAVDSGRLSRRSGVSLPGRPACHSIGLGRPVYPAVNQSTSIHNGNTPRSHARSDARELAAQWRWHACRAARAASVRATARCTPPRSSTQARLHVTAGEGHQREATHDCQQSGERRRCAASFWRGPQPYVSPKRSSHLLRVSRSFASQTSARARQASRPSQRG